ncbi:TPA: molybdopterin-dependent oxidoreductase [Escherichia coli]|uniref:molybdopterin-dependent oxidoreductase n=1 Tax=Enterobacter ludwigii TaxID=299767 RepID=UPI001989658B|nr:molybdopterin-dependent oxidoreductase [Enterobacter ludwigii]EDE3323452.1 molybdopterin-dependent oxidoreductase [Salmonella enterica subsp. enterica serovar Montevideo]EGC5371490.1 molybdopterin-dependent oxidoreductase [Escherichia coli]MDF1081857.1 molybdopterin-dependent oxidoreductase [Escherichia coli]UOH53965.1 molybdopterin-dependent oxidoreductase [Enterobacter ludwigii]HDQ3791060.1 molybdopterin-dependent oxidoreductase [Escherichia coli]
MNRRHFLTGCAALGVGVGASIYGKVFYRAGTFSDAGEQAKSTFYGQSTEPEWLLDKETGQHVINPNYMVRHSVCLQCHGECGLRAKVNRKTGKLERLQGNPYHPNTLIDYKDMNIPVVDTANTPGTLCARGNAGLQTAYDPYRLTVPLKRSGPRGSNKWVPIEWEKLIDEVVNGGKIFADTGDEASQNLEIKGFRALYEKRDEWIDDNNHDLGRVSNKLVIQSGRIVKTRKDFQTRFAKSFGTVNNYEHTNICELSHHIATSAVYTGHNNFKADLCESDFVLYWGTAPGEANFPMQTLGKYSAEARSKGCKIAVIDPVLPRTITDDPNMFWLAPRPGTDGAIAMGMISWIIEHNRHNTDFLSYPNQSSAKNAGETCFTDASYLIITDETHPNFGKFITSSEAALGDSKDSVVINLSGIPELAEKCVKAMLDYSGNVNGIGVATAFHLLKTSASDYSLEYYADISGVRVDDIVNLADEFTKHGRKASTEFYRGIAQHPNGYYTGFAINQLNVLIGNLNWSGGGSLGGGGFPYDKGVYDLTAIPSLVPAQFGIKITREDGFRYEDSTEFKTKVARGEPPYPAKRPWFPFTKDIFSDILPSALEGYPYTADILLWHMCTPLYSAPGMGKEDIIRGICDPTKIPLIIASDIVVSDTSMYADYIIPDITYLERYVQHPMLEATMVKGTAVRYPVIEPLTGKNQAGQHFCLETFFIDIASKLNMAGFGKNAIPDSNGTLWPLEKMEDYYLKGTANVAYSGTPVSDATEDDIKIAGLEDYQKKYSSSLKSDEWRKVLFLMSRGGRFEPVTTRRNGTQLKNQFNNRIRMYNEKIAQGLNSFTGERFSGTALWQPSLTMMGKKVDELDQGKGMDFTILTRKSALQTQSRLSSNSFIREIQPTNWAEINTEDGKALGLKTGDSVWVETVEGRRHCEVKLRDGVAPGVISFIVGYGHWGYGATDIDIGGKRIKGSKIRAAGINLNPIMRLDPDVWGMPLMDPIGGSSSFFNTRAKIIKA